MVIESILEFTKSLRSVKNSFNSNGVPYSAICGDEEKRHSFQISFALHI